MKNNKVKFIFVALLFATQVEAFSSWFHIFSQ